MDRRAFLSGGAAVLTAPFLLRANAALAQIRPAIGSLLLFGFAGSTDASEGAQSLARSISEGLAGGAMFLGQNIGSRTDLAGLTSLFGEAAADVVIAADQEGGEVQRLSRALGATDLPRPRAVANRMSVEEARELYGTAAREFGAAGFNVNFGPVVDVDDPASPIIGAYGRGFSSDPSIVVEFGEAFVDGFAAAKIGGVLKHFPGQGRCRRDTHAGPADGTPTWTSEELVPFRRLIGSRRIVAVMTSHMQHDMFLGLPASLSAIAVQTLLRRDLGHRGVVVTDDLNMRAITDVVSPEEAIVRAVAAGNDMILSSASVSDSSWPRQAVDAIMRGLADGAISEAQIWQSVRRVARWKRSIWQ